VIPAEYLNTILTGDARELSLAIPDNSVDLVFCDPPYAREHLHLYDWLGREAVRILRPGGFLLAYTGGATKDDVMGILRQHLRYFWDFVTLDGHASVLWGLRVLAGYKSILAYVKGDGLPRLITQSVWKGGGADKRYHAWGQDESTARYYIECFSKVGDVVFDPFMGGGTTAAMCKQLARQYIGFEVDAVTAARARERVQGTQMPLPAFMPGCPSFLDEVTA
jgi:SAM-dependent methyltransferase